MRYVGYPAGRLGLALPVPELQDRESGEGHDAEDRLLDAFDEAAAKKLMDCTWERSTKVWVTPVCDGVASIVDGLSGLQHQWHDLVLGEPTRSLSEQMNLEAPSGDVLASVAAELALPGDPSFKAIKRMVQFTGIFVGVVGGQPLLANACLKSLVHDLVAEAISKAIGDVIRNALEPTRTREHDLEVPEVRSQHTRQIEELKREIAHQHQKELKREELKERIQERTINHDRDGYRVQEHIDDDRDRYRGQEHTIDDDRDGYRMQEHIDDDRDRYRGQEHTIDDDRDIDQ
jgi:hypothetical protein